MKIIALIGGIDSLRARKFVKRDCTDLTNFSFADVFFLCIVHDVTATFPYLREKHTARENIFSNVVRVIKFRTCVLRKRLFSVRIADCTNYMIQYRKYFSIYFSFLACQVTRSEYWHVSSVIFCQLFRRVFSISYELCCKHCSQNFIKFCRKSRYSFNYEFLFPLHNFTKMRTNVRFPRKHRLQSKIDDARILFIFTVYMYP